MPGDLKGADWFPASTDFEKMKMQAENHGARRFQHLSPPRPGLDRLLKESAERVKNMTDEERRKMVDEQVRNIMPIQPNEMRARETPMQRTIRQLSRFADLTEEIAAELKEQDVKRDELRIGRVTPLTLGDGERKGIVSGSCVKHLPGDPLRGHRQPTIPSPFEPMFPRPSLDLAKLEAERKRRAEAEAREFVKQHYAMDDLTLFEKQLREARCPICGGREGCDHPKEERIREFARAGIRAQQKSEQEKAETYVTVEKATAILSQKANRHGCAETPNPQKSALPDNSKDEGTKETKAPRILVVAASHSQQFRLQSLTTENKYLVVRPLDALPLGEKFSTVILAVRSLIEELSINLDRKHERDSVRAWLDGLRYVTVSRDLKDVIYL